MHDLTMLEAFTPRGMMKLTLDMMRQACGAFALALPARAGGAAMKELENKLGAFSFFEHADCSLRISPRTRAPLPVLIEKALALGTYDSVWAMEGLGHYYAEAAWQMGTPRSLLKAERAIGLPSKSLVPLHAGMGLSFANRVLANLSSRGPASAVGAALDSFAALCEDNSGQGYFGAAYEPLGLVARNLYPHLVAAIDRHLSETELGLLSYFWHGVGRGLYFAPTNFLSATASSRRALQMARREPPHETGRANAVAGVAWALSMVNIRQPEVLETFLRNLTSDTSASDAFSNGVGSSMIVWLVSTGAAHYVTRLCEHQPDPREPQSTRTWESLVKRPCKTALESYGLLQDRGAIGEVFRLRPLEELAARQGGAPQ